MMACVGTKVPGKVHIEYKEFNNLKCKDNMVIFAGANGEKHYRIVCPFMFSMKNLTTFYVEEDSQGEEIIVSIHIDMPEEQK